MILIRYLGFEFEICTYFNRHGFLQGCFLFLVFILKNVFVGVWSFLFQGVSVNVLLKLIVSGNFWFWRYFMYVCIYSYGLLCGGVCVCVYIRIYVHDFLFTHTHTRIYFHG